VQNGLTVAMQIDQISDVRKAIEDHITLRVSGSEAGQGPT
jgi:hypothetical protein